MKIGFIGCGNMASAICKGLISSSNAVPKDINVFDISAEAMEKLSVSDGVNRFTSISQLFENSEIVVLAVKPNIIEKVLTENKDAIIANSPLIISIAAGKTLDFLQSNVPSTAKLARVMPNINAKVGAAISAFCVNKNVTEQDKEKVECIFSSVGTVMELDESQFPVFGVIAGCAPAYSYMFIDALARGAVKNGMNKQVALQIATQTVFGSAKMIAESGEHPWQLIDHVCSPGGTTIEGVTSLQADGFESAVHNAIDKAVQKDSKL